MKFWSLGTSFSYTFTSLVHHILCIVKHVGMEIIAFTLTSKQTLYALNHYFLLSVLPKVFTQKKHSCRVRMDSFLHRRRSEAFFSRLQNRGGHNLAGCGNFSTACSFYCTSCSFYCTANARSDSENLQKFLKKWLF